MDIPWYTQFNRSRLGRRLLTASNYWDHPPRSPLAKKFTCLPRPKSKLKSSNRRPVFFVEGLLKPPLIGFFANRCFQENNMFPSKKSFRQPFAIHLTISYNVRDWEQGTNHGKSRQISLVDFVCVCDSELDMFLRYFSGWSYKDPRHARISKKFCRGSNIHGLKPSRTLNFQWFSAIVYQECAGFASFIYIHIFTILQGVKS